MNFKSSSSHPDDFYFARILFIPTGQASGVTHSPDITPSGAELIWDFPSVAHDPTKDYIPAYIQTDESAAFFFDLPTDRLDPGTYSLVAIVNRWTDIETDQVVYFPGGLEYQTSWQFRIQL